MYYDIILQETGQHKRLSGIDFTVYGLSERLYFTAYRKGYNDKKQSPYGIVLIVGKLWII